MKGRRRLVHCPLLNLDTSACAKEEPGTLHSHHRKRDRNSCQQKGSIVARQYSITLIDSVSKGDSQGIQHWAPCHPLSTIIHHYHHVPPLILEKTPLLPRLLRQSLPSTRQIVRSSTAKRHPIAWHMSQQSPSKPRIKSFLLPSFFPIPT